MKFKKYIVLFLLLCEFISLFLTYKSFLNKEINVAKESYIVNKKTFSMFVENEEGNYAEYTESNSFPSNYVINLEKSSCVDTKGNVIEDILSFNSNNITIKSNRTSYCYLYFDIPSLTAADTLIANAGDDLWASTLEDDGYRYVGTNPDNYICFGTTSQSECTGNTDLYMYRIIGIFEDNEGTKHLKLIKKEALNTNYVWDSQYSLNIDWDGSTLFNGLNGSYFLTNTTYSYMQDSTWINKIEKWHYTATNTKTSENSGQNYYNTETIKNIYLHEMNRSTKPSIVGEWKTVSTQIGLMYISDYLLSLGSDILLYTTYTNREILKTAWIHIVNNDSSSLSTTNISPSSQHEWTMTRYGLNSGVYNSWYIDSSGFVNAVYVQIDTITVRPVFYLTSDVTIVGDGTIDSPYIIS